MEITGKLLSQLQLGGHFVPDHVYTKHEINELIDDYLIDIMKEDDLIVVKYKGDHHNDPVTTARFRGDVMVSQSHDWSGTKYHGQAAVQRKSLSDKIRAAMQSERD